MDTNATRHRADRRTREPSGRTRSEQIEVRASWILETWATNPALGYGEMQAEVQARFEIGVTASKAAIKRAYEILDEKREAFTVDRIFIAYMHVYEEAFRARDWNAARRTLDSLRAHLGLGAPERLHLTRQLEPVRDLSDLTDDELAILAKLDQPRG